MVGLRGGGRGKGRGNSHYTTCVFAAIELWWHHWYAPMTKRML